MNLQVCAQRHNSFVFGSSQNNSQKYQIIPEQLIQQLPKIVPQYHTPETMMIPFSKAYTDDD